MKKPLRHLACTRAVVTVGVVVIVPHTEIPVAGFTLVVDSAGFLYPPQQMQDGLGLKVLDGAQLNLETFCPRPRHGG